MGADARPTPSAVDSTPGYYDLGASARAFDAPLFGNDSLTTYHLFGNQRLPGAGTYSVWLIGGIPGYTPQFGIEGAEIPVAGRLARINAGDFALGPLLPDALSGSADALPLDGARARLDGDRASFSVFGGTAKYDLALPGEPGKRPSLYGGEVLVRRDGDFYGAGLTLVERPVFGGPEAATSRSVVLSGRYVREVSPWAYLFSEASSADGRALGVRAGVQWRFESGSLSTSVYSFGSGFPYVYPLYRPGERGLDLKGRIRPTEFSTLYGDVDYASDQTVLHRSDLRGSLGYALSFGSNRPSLSLDYSREDLAYDSLVAPRSGLLVDRFALAVSKDSSFGFLRASLAHDRSARGDGLDRTQALLAYRTVLGSSSLLDGSAVVQRDGSGNFGFTAESAVQRPLSSRLDYLVGAGGDYLDRGRARSGEGLARVGLSLRAIGSGWYVRAELRLPFAVGLERSRLNRRIVSLDLGNRLAWKQGPAARRSSSSATAAMAPGTVEGAVRRNGDPEGGVAVVVDGEPLAVTHADGSYRLRHLPAGRRQVTIDLRGLDPRFSVTGGASREVEVLPNRVTRADFEIEPFASLQGFLVACGSAGPIPIGGARLTLSNGAISRAAETSNVGGFRFGEVPPGLYEMEIDPASVSPRVPPDELPRFRVDLSDDCLGQVVRVRCPVEPEAAADSRRVCVRPPEGERYPSPPAAP